MSLVDAGKTPEELEAEEAEKKARLIEELRRTKPVRDEDRDWLQGPDRRRTEGGAKYQIKEIREKHKEVLRRAALGQSGRDIARALGWTEVMVSKILNSRICKHRINELQDAADAETKEISKRIREIVPRALTVLEAMVDNEDAITDAQVGLRVKVAQDIMDRGGFGKTKRVEQRVDVRGDRDWVDGLLDIVREEAGEEEEGEDFKAGEEDAL